MEFVLHNRKNPKLPASEMYSKLGTKSTSSNPIKNNLKQKHLQNSLDSWLSFSFTFKKLGICTLFIFFIYALISSVIEREYFTGSKITSERYFLFNFVKLVSFVFQLFLNKQYHIMKFMRGCLKILQ